MIEPPPASRMAGTHALQHCQTPRTLTAHGAVPLVLLDPVEAPALDVAVERGVVDEHVDAPELGDRVRRHGLAARHVGGVEGNAAGAPARGADGVDRLGRVADIGGDHGGTFARQRLAIGAAQAPPAAGDDGDLPFKLRHGASRFSRSLVRAGAAAPSPAGTE